MSVSNCVLIIIIKVFLKRKILSLETALSARAHTHTTPNNIQQQQKPRKNKISVSLKARKCTVVRHSFCCCKWQTLVATSTDNKCVAAYSAVSYELA